MLGKVQIPVAPVGDPNGFSFLCVNDFLKIDGRGNNIHQNIPGDDGNESRAGFHALHKGKFGKVHCVNVARHPGDALLVRIHNSDEVAVIVFIVEPPMNDVNFSPFCKIIVTI
jgi:hypothetical protein